MQIYEFYLLILTIPVNDKIIKAIKVSKIYELVLTLFCQIVFTNVIPKSEIY